MPTRIFKHKLLSQEHKENIKKGMKKFFKFHSWPQGKNSHSWKGGRPLYGGYVFIYQPQHPRANKEHYVKRANLVMEKYLGRYLKPEEIVHHINSIRDDDRFKNLQLTNKADHMRIHCPNKNISKKTRIKINKAISITLKGHKVTKKTRKRISNSLKRYNHRPYNYNIL